MNKNTTNDSLGQVLKHCKLPAPENLSHRIMHQVQTEALFARSAQKKETKIRSSIYGWLTTLGVLYALLAAVTGAFYVWFGADFLYMATYYYLLVLIGVAGSVFSTITFFDEKRRSKQFVTKSI